MLWERHSVEDTICGIFLLECLNRNRQLTSFPIKNLNQEVNPYLNATLVESENKKKKSAVNRSSYNSFSE